MSYLGFKDIAHYGSTTLTDELAHNIAAWIENGLQNIGAYTNITINTSGVYGGDFSRLRSVQDPYYTNGKVWESARSNWVYATGILYSPAPIRISGVYVNGAFQPATGIGTYAHNYDYINGRVIFDTATTVTGVVRLEYSYKNVHVSTSDVTWFRQIQLDSLRVDSSHFLYRGSGVWNTLAQSRVQLPAVVVEATTRANFPRGLELGGGHYKHQDVLLHVLAEHPSDRNRLCDIFTHQKDKKIYIFDINKVSDSGVWTVRFDGSINPSGLQYYQLVDEHIGYRKRSCDFVNTVSQEARNLGSIYIGTVRVTCEIPIPTV
jgi:hypothetical protein